MANVNINGGGGGGFDVDEGGGFEDDGGGDAGNGDEGNGDEGNGDEGNGDEGGGGGDGGFGGGEHEGHLGDSDGGDGGDDAGEEGDDDGPEQDDSSEVGFGTDTSNRSPAGTLGRSPQGEESSSGPGSSISESQTRAAMEALEHEMSAGALGQVSSQMREGASPGSGDAIKDRDSAKDTCREIFSGSQAAGDEARDRFREEMGLGSNASVECDPTLDSNGRISGWELNYDNTGHGKARFVHGAIRLSQR